MRENGVRTARAPGALFLACDATMVPGELVGDGERELGYVGPDRRRSASGDALRFSQRPTEG
jgi:hypothetical protein